MNFSEQVLSAHIPDGSLGIFFLGQAGFIVKTPSGELTVIDPYLSNCCEAEFGFKRLMPMILEPKELVFDSILLTHAHHDHFDPDSIPLMVENGKTRLVGAKDIVPECERLGIKANIETLSLNDRKDVGELTVIAMPCDHGELAPDAIGLLIEGYGKKIFLMGDTAYRSDYLENKSLCGLDLLILPINGAFGNLNEEEAALVVKELKPKMTVPCHYWNFAEHGGNPLLFKNAMAKNCPEANYTLMYQGEMMIL